MKKITKKDLDGLLDFPVIKREDLRKIVGGITQQQFDEWIGVWPGGYVDGWGYVGPETVIYGYPSNNSNNSNNWGGYGFYEYATNSEWWQSFMYDSNNPSYSYPSQGYNSSATSFVLSEYLSTVDRGSDVCTIMYKGGFEQGFKIGKNGGVLPAIGAHLLSLIYASGAGGEFGKVNYEAIHLSAGIEDGYNKARQLYGGD
ncbi:MAG: hypothetical protein LBS52_03580 [Dysgonamonadaceae bacterium]|jgi:hypothetical protein|nr:hypothetical protein [Dysgonamonadaceae bacterium]